MAATQAAESNRIARAGYQNAFLLVCDLVAQRNTHEKLSFEELPMYLKAIKSADRDQYDALRDALMTLNMALIKKAGSDWWDSCAWDDTPASVALAASILQVLK